MFRPTVRQGFLCGTSPRQHERSQATWRLSTRALTPRWIHRGLCGGRGLLFDSWTVWNIGAKSDCLRLIQIPDAAPLRGRKSLDYAIWRAAARWWIGDDPSVRPAGRDWEPMAYLKQRLEEIKRYDPLGGPPPIDSLPGLHGDWGDYLSGFLTAEGSLGIVSNGRRLHPALTVRVRRDDYGLLQQLRSRTGVGRLYREQPPVNGRSPAAMWLVKRRDELSRLVQMLDKHPLRGRKAAEYAVWRTAALVFASRRDRARVWAELKRLRAQLVEARRYRRREDESPY
jgi:hypothetical protein